MKKEPLAESGQARQWTSPDDYLASLARRRTARAARDRTKRPRSEPEVPRFALSTLPFIAMMIALALLGVGIMIAAWPGSQPRPKQQQIAHEQGTAPKGWLQEAEKEFH